MRKHGGRFVQQYTELDALQGTLTEGGDGGLLTYPTCSVSSARWRAVMSINAPTMRTGVPVTLRTTKARSQTMAYDPSARRKRYSVDQMFVAECKKA